MPRGYSCLAVLLLLSLFVWAGSTWEAGCLYITDGKESLRYKVKAGDTVRLSYRHSLYRDEQTEVFTVGASRLLLREMIFGSFNSLYYYDERDSNYYEKDGNIHLPVTGKEFRAIPIRLSYSESHVLRIESSEYPQQQIELSKRFRPGARVEMGLRGPLF